MARQAGLPVLSLGGLPITGPEVDRNALSTRQWVEHVGDETDVFARALANMERPAVRQTPWRTWKWIRDTGCNRLA